MSSRPSRTKASTKKTKYPSRPVKVEASYNSVGKNQTPADPGKGGRRDPQMASILGATAATIPTLGGLEGPLGASGLPLGVCFFSLGVFCWFRHVFFSVLAWEGPQSAPTGSPKRPTGSEKCPQGTPIWHLPLRVGFHTEFENSREFCPA